MGHKACWLPQWLDRILPTVDVEGERLHQQLAQRPADPDQDRGLGSV
ncbi:hypothetical protein ACFY74_32225 [Streptomyces massasporeus]